MDNDDKNIIVIEAGGHGKELRSYIDDITRHGEKIHFVGFVDEQKPRGPREDSQIIGDFTALEDFLKQNQSIMFSYITAVGNNRIRREFVQKIEALNVQNLKAGSLYHPLKSIGKMIEIGEGTCLAPGSIVTTCAKIGKHCILNVNTSVSHDSVIEDYVNINPGATICGNVKIGQGCYIGAQATVIDNVSIGNWTTIGAGAVVTEDLPAHVTAVGVPARAVIERDLKEGIKHGL